MSEYVLLGEAGFEPLGFVVGSSIYHVGLQIHRRAGPEGGQGSPATRMLRERKSTALRTMRPAAIVVEDE